MSRKKRAPVVITRKDKRLNKPFHLAAFMLSGGMSAPVSAAKAASNAAYNARTRDLADRAEGNAASDDAAAFRAAHVPGSREYQQRTADRQRRETLHERAEQAREATTGLTYRESKPGREAFKAARRAGKSVDEARKASRAALDEVRRQKYGDAAAAQQEASPAAPEARSIEARLAEVARLRDAGVLTDEEHAAKRAEIIKEL